MTINGLNGLLKALAGGISGFRVAGRLLYHFPVTSGMLAGCYFEASDFEKKTVQVTCFATILAYPLTSLAFDLSFRLRDGRGGDRWSLDNGGVVVSEMMDAIKLQALPFVERMQSAETFAEELSSGAGTIQGQRAAAVAFARAGETKRALDMIAKVSQQVNPSVGWQSEIAAKLTELSGQLEAGKGASLLDSWEAGSVKLLKVG